MQTLAAGSREFWEWKWLGGCQLWGWGTGLGRGQTARAKGGAGWGRLESEPVGGTEAQFQSGQELGRVPDPLSCTFLVC